MSDNWKFLECILSGFGMLGLFKVLLDVFTEPIKKVVISTWMAWSILLDIIDDSFKDDGLIVLFVLEVVFHNFLFVLECDVVF